MSLADELLADFEEDDLGQNEEEEADEEMAEVAEVAAEVDYTSKESVRHVAKLRDSKEVGALYSISTWSVRGGLLKEVNIWINFYITKNNVKDHYNEYNFHLKSLWSLCSS